MKRAAQRRLSDMTAHGQTPSEALLRVAHAERATTTTTGTADAVSPTVTAPGFAGHGTCSGRDS
jgi:hypothetical protein